MRPTVTYANVASTLALIVALGSGGAYAASLAKNSVTSKHIKNGTIQAVDMAAGSVTGTQLTDGSVTAAKLAPGAVPNPLTDGSVTTGKLADGSVTAAKFAPGAVPDASIPDGSVTGPKLAGDSVTGAKIADGAVAGADLAADSVTGAKVSADSITGADIAESSLGEVTFAHRSLTVLAASVNANGTVNQPRSYGLIGVTTHLLGFYEVAFNRSLAVCTFVAAIDSTGLTQPAFATVSQYNTNSVRVLTYDDGGTAVDRNFNIVVVC